MAKIQHLYSTTAGNVPSSLVRGQVAINIPDRIVYANDPMGKVTPISKGTPGVANASTLLGSHIPVQFHPVAQFGVGMSEADLVAAWSDDGTTAVLQPVRVFILGRAYYTPVLSCPSINTGAYKMVLNTVTKSTAIVGMTSGSIGTGSSTANAATGDVSLVFRSDGYIYPWFYLPVGYSSAGSTVSMYRISPYKTFGAIPVSAGFAGAPASAYWGSV